MAEATIWYRRACYDGDPRAGQKVIEIQLAARRRADNHGSTRVDPAAAAQDAPEISEGLHQPRGMLVQTDADLLVALS